MDRFHKTHLVIGMGEVGRALHEVLSSRYETEGIDKGQVPTRKTFDMLHICYPPMERFIPISWEYIKTYATDDSIIVNHSSVEVGTTRRLGLNAVHSPIRGVHPNLAKGIRTFCKYFGGERAVDAADYFLDLGIPTKVYHRPETTEALKLWDTTQYGFNIVLMRAIHDYCEKHGLEFDAIYTHANQTYNEGYHKLGMGHVNRPVLKYMPGPIGGHCILPNAALLDDPIGDIILEANATY